MRPALSRVAQIIVGQAQVSLAARHFAIAEDDEYECPAASAADLWFCQQKGGKMMRRFWASACMLPPHQICTPSNHRVSVAGNEATVEAAEARPEQHPD